MRLNRQEVVAALRQNGYKLTPQRRVVIQVILSTKDHLTPAEIYEKVHQDYPNIGFTTVYRTLEILGRLNLICEVHAGGSCHSYTIAAAGHHHHLICSGCGVVVDFPALRLREIETNLSVETGFRIDGHLLEFFGLCQNCQKTSA